MPALPEVFAVPAIELDSHRLLWLGANGYTFDSCGLSGRVYFHREQAPRLTMARPVPAPVESASDRRAEAEERDWRADHGHAAPDDMGPAGDDGPELVNRPSDDGPDA